MVSYNTHRGVRGVSISKLEILACLLLSELVISVVDAVKSEVRIIEICCWNDSDIAIWWIVWESVESLG